MSYLFSGPEPLVTSHVSSKSLIYAAPAYVYVYGLIARSTYYSTIDFFCIVVDSPSCEYQMKCRTASYKYILLRDHVDRLNFFHAPHDYEASKATQRKQNTNTTQEYTPLFASLRFSRGAAAACVTCVHRVWYILACVRFCDVFVSCVRKYATLCAFRWITVSK